MSASCYSGIIFANSHDKTIPELTEHRSMASLPFGARYRLVDFALSNFVNAGVHNIGIITKSNYRSLADHIGSGIYWDLDRRNGGVHILSPFYTKSARRYHGYVEALYGAKDFMLKSGGDNIVLADGGIAANIDISAALEFHNEKNADITVVYSENLSFENSENAIQIETDENEKIVSAQDILQSADFSKTSIGVFIFKRELLIKLIKTAYENNACYLERDVIAKNIDKLAVFGFKHNGFVSVMDSFSDYFKANIKLLSKDVRLDLFNKDRPIYTKTRDDMPTRYGIHSSVKNSLIADGCIIEGTVKNSIIFRGVKIERGATVQNCILMQGCNIGKDVKLSYVVSDKDTSVSAGMTLMGSENNAMIIKKGLKL